MPVTVVDFEEKKYVIADAEFKLKKPTLGIKRRGASLASILLFRLQELAVISVNFVRDTENIDAVEESVTKKSRETAEQINEIGEDIFIKAEELFKIIIEPVKPEDITKLMADNIDEKILTEVINDFFQLAGLSTTPANS